MSEQASRYVVVVNDEEQHSVWAAGREIPSGWYALDVEGTREECLEHIGRTWTDMRPKSLRASMGES